MNNFLQQYKALQGKVYFDVSQLSAISIFMSTVVRLHYETMFRLLSRKMSETRMSFNYASLILAYASLLINYFYSNCYSLIHDDFFIYDPHASQFCEGS